MKKAGIIGGAGFIGSYITKIFLDNGFEVKVSATDISKEEKYEHLMALDHAGNLHVSELNVLDKPELFNFVSDCDIVVHAGTPFRLDVKDPKTELFDPTIDGTENFLEAVMAAQQIEKVVMVASVASYNTNFPMPPSGKTAAQTIDESDVPFRTTESHPYALAKFIANQAVLNFIGKHTDIKFEITSVSPVWVTGKSLSKRMDSISGGLQFQIKNKITSDPFVEMLFEDDVAFAIVDVRDVAEAVFQSATRKGLHGKNYLLSSQTYKTSDICRMLNRQEPYEDPIVVYKNDMAKKDLNINFNPAKSPLQNFSR